MSRRPEELAPRLWRVPLPLPSFPGAEHLGFCNAYLIGGSGGWLLVDTGMTTDEAARILNDGLREAGIAWRDVDRVLITHHHPDHYGGSRAIRERTGARLMMHRRDVEMMYDTLWGDESIPAFIAAHGGPRIEGPDPLFGVGSFRPAAPDEYLEDDQVFDLGDRRVRVLHTPGHSPGHCCFAIGDERIVLTGDHILPKITPHVGTFPAGDPNPLASFLDSLKRVGEGGFTRALPAHGEPFLDPGSHVARIVAHHEFRVRAIVDALGREPRTAWDVVPDVFGDVSGAHRFAALFEALSHLVLAASEGKIVREDDGDLVRWRRVP